ncbi:MAG: hypothetical protein JWM58_2011 [Rhizobium sp.]|nr:hypothetical protein [Rhizobium sp.]
MSTSVHLLIGRILLAIIFLLSGFGKLADPVGTAGMISGAGLPAATALAYLSGIFELVVGIAVVVGFQIKIAAYLLAAFSVVSAILFHMGGADPMSIMINQIMFLKNLAMAGGFLVLAAFGAGSISIDARRAQ